MFFFSPLFMALILCGLPLRRETGTYLNFTLFSFVLSYSYSIWFYRILLYSTEFYLILYLLICLTSFYSITSDVVYMMTSNITRQCLVSDDFGKSAFYMCLIYAVLHACSLALMGTLLHHSLISLIFYFLLCVLYIMLYIMPTLLHLYTQYKFYYMLH